MKLYKLNNVKETELHTILQRVKSNSNVIRDRVEDILDNVQKNGISAVVKYSKQYEGLNSDNLLVTVKEFKEAEKRVSEEFKVALQKAATNIEKFHSMQKPGEYTTEIIPGVTCGRKYEALEKVGLYIPGGTAPLVSTVLMLGIPAKIAGCKDVTICTPASQGKVSPELLYAISYTGYNKVYKTGGAQAIALMAYIEKVNKIFGPGNRYVTTAKSLINSQESNCTIDMPAGPSEVLVIADSSANPVFVAADLLSQLEHGTDSQAVLVTDSEQIISDVKSEIIRQKEYLSRTEIVNDSLENLILIKVNDTDTAIELSNYYAPEHLIINTENAEQLFDKVRNTGSLFLGAWSPESAGDYASGTNHTLPTSGYSKVYSGLGTEAFMRSYTWQKISENGLSELANPILNLAEVEGLDAHANAVKVRLQNGN